ncbi:hypothetical protein G6F45_014263 [Rhizopus arrhizus]|nr:hypothetical protein G6F45_014263 [Rhizopus arrhizus]
MWVDDRCTMVTLAPPSQSAAQISWAELLAPMTPPVLPRYASGPGCCDECCCSPWNSSWPGKRGMFGLPDMPVASTSCLGRSTTGLPSRSTVTSHSFFCSS